jgi:hypothetical protein
LSRLFLHTAWMMKKNTMFPIGWRSRFFRLPLPGRGNGGRENRSGMNRLVRPKKKELSRPHPKPEEPAKEPPFFNGFRLLERTSLSSPDDNREPILLQTSSNYIIRVVGKQARALKTPGSPPCRPSIRRDRGGGRRPDPGVPCRNRRRNEGGVMGDRFRLIYLKSTDADPSEGGSAPLQTRETGDRDSSPEGAPHPSGGSLASLILFEQVRSDLKHPDPRMRELAARYLGNADPSDALPLLREALTDTVRTVRLEAVRSLVALGTPAGLPLFKRLLKDTDPAVRMAALRGYFRQGERFDQNLLLQILSDESAFVRRKVATLLAWSPMDGALPVLAELARDPDAKVRKAALSSLVALYPEESEERLLRALEDPDPGLRRWARKHLEGILASPRDAAVKVREGSHG